MAEPNQHYMLSNRQTRCVGTDTDATTELTTPTACDNSHDNEAAARDKSFQTETDTYINSTHVREQSPCRSPSPVEGQYSWSALRNSSQTEYDALSQESNSSNNGTIVQRLHDTEALVATSSEEQATMETKDGPSCHQMEDNNVCDANRKRHQWRPPDISDSLQACKTVHSQYENEELSQDTYNESIDNVKASGSNEQQQMRHIWSLKKSPKDEIISSAEICGQDIDGTDVNRSFEDTATELFVTKHYDTIMEVPSQHDVVNYTDVYNRNTRLLDESKYTSTYEESISGNTSPATLNVVQASDGNDEHLIRSFGSLEILTVGHGEQLIAVRGDGIKVHSQHGSYNDQVINLSPDEGCSSSPISVHAGDTTRTADIDLFRDGGAAEAEFQKSDRVSLSHVVHPRPEIGPVRHEYVRQKSMVIIQGGESNRQELLTARRQDSTHEGSQSGQTRDTSTEEETDSPYQAMTFGQPTSVNVHFESPCDVFLQTGERNRQWIYADSRLLENKRAYRQRSLNMTILPTPGLCNAPPGVHVHMTTYTHPVPVVTLGEQSSVRSINNGVVDSLRIFFRVFGLEMLTVNPKGYGYTFTFWTDEVDKAIDTLKMYNCHIKEIYCRTLLIDERVCDTFPFINVRCTFWKSESYSGNKEFIITL